MSEVTVDTMSRGGVNRPGVAFSERVRAGWRQGLHLRRERPRVADRAFDIELLRLFAESRMASVPALMIVALGVAAVSLIWARMIDVAVWLVMISASQTLSYLSARKLAGMPQAHVNIRLWRRRFVTTEICHGMSWATLSLLFLEAPDTNAQIFVLFALMLSAALTSLVSASVPRAVYAGLAPTTCAVLFCVNPVWEAQAWPLALVAGSSQFFFIILAQRLHAANRSSLSFRLEKDMLIAELEQAKANSDEARRRAEEANLAKSRFLATMSHELRTPLNAILGFSEVMKNEIFGRHGVPAYRDYAQDIHSSGQHLLMLINEILDLSRVEAGRYELREAPLALSHAIDESLRLLIMRAEKRGVAIHQQIEATLPRIWADERALQQILLNLLTNAIKFTPRGGSITIKCGWTQSGGQYVSIRDTGPGIPPHEIPLVLSSFGRGSLAQTNADEGSGLGLPIVKGLVELHDGVFQLESELGGGTDATVIFPASRVLGDARPGEKRRRRLRSHARKAA